MGDFSLIYHWASESAFKIFARWGTVTLVLSMADSRGVGEEGGYRKTEEKDYFWERPSWEEGARATPSGWEQRTSVPGFGGFKRREEGWKQRFQWGGKTSLSVWLCYTMSTITDNLHLEISVWSKRGLEEKPASRLSGSCKGPWME